MQSSSMDDNIHSTQTKTIETSELPKVLILGPPTSAPVLKSYYSHKFHFLNYITSTPDLPLHQFLAIENAEPSSVRAVICSPSFPPTRDVLQLLPFLGLLVTFSIGLDHIDFHECQRRGIKVAWAGDSFAEDVADMAVGLLIDVMTKITAADRNIRKSSKPGSWDFPIGSKVERKKIGIMGLGRIGLEVAKRLEAFGCAISYCSRKKNPKVSYAYHSDVVKLAAASDVLVVCCTLNKESKHIIDREVMLALGKEGVIVNVGRGALIDEKELVRCLVEGDIGGAGLDVFEKEPHVPKELFALDNVVMTPHKGSSTTESVFGKCQIVIANLEAFFSNQPLLTPTNGYICDHLKYFCT